MRTAGHLALAFALVTLTGTTKALTNETAITESTAISSQPANAWVYNPIASNNLIVSLFCQDFPVNSMESPDLVKASYQSQSAMNGGTGAIGQVDQDRGGLKRPGGLLRSLLDA